MPTQIQLRRGSTAQTALFIGAAGEVTVNTDKKTIVVHDDITVGGTILSTEANTGAGLITVTNAYQANVGVEVAARSANVGAARIADVASGQANTGAGLITVTNAYQANTGAVQIAKLDKAGGTITGNLTVSGITTLGNGAVLGVPASGTATNLTGTANITVTGGASGAIAATTLTTSSTVTINGGTANGVAYLNGSKVLTTGSALNYDGSKFDVIRSATTTTAFDEPVIRAINSGTATLNQRVDVALRFQDGTYNGIGGISMLRESATARSGALLFSPIGSDGNGTEKMRITSAGLVGINTDVPDTPLVIKGGSNIALKIISDSGSGTTATLYGGANAGVRYGALTLNRSDTSAITTFITGDSTDSSYIAGNLGIGTTSPATKLNAAISAANETTSALRVTNLNASGYGVGIEFADELSSGRVAARIASITPATSATGDLYFQTRTASALTEKMRLDSNGNLGIGTSSPQRILSIANGGPVVEIDPAGISSTNPIYFNYNRTTSTYLTPQYWALAHNWMVNGGTSAMFLNSSGNLGIGTSSPAYRLEVATGTEASGQIAVANFRTASTTASYNSGIQIYATASATAASRQVVAVWDADGANSSGGDYFLIQKSGNSGVTDILNYSNAAIRFGANYTNRVSYDMTLDTSGNLGIGTTSPNSKLTVNGGQTRILSSTAFASNPLDTGSWSGAITVNTNDGAGDLSGIGMYVNSSYTAACGIFAKQTSSTTADLTFFTGSGVVASNVERARIDSSGRLLVGLTSSILSNGIVQIGGSADTRLVIDSSSTQGIFFSKSGADNGTYRVDGSGNHNWFIAGSAPANMTLDVSGNLLVGGTTQLGKLTVESTTAGVYTGYNRNTNATPGAAIIDLSIFSAASPNNTTSGFYFASDNVGAKAIIYSNGGLHNYSANDVNLSDRREKINFAPAGSYLDKICAIPVQTFNYIDQNLEEDGGLTLGVVAQDVQSVAPELVMESNWASKDDEPKMRLSIYQTDLQYALMKCIQEQQALITQLTARITALETA